MKSKGILGEFLKDVVSTTVYLLNRATTKSVINKTPYEAYYDKKPIKCWSPSHLWLHCTCERCDAAPPQTSRSKQANGPSLGMIQGQMVIGFLIQTQEELS
jgi:hypothetical protein